MLSSPCCDTKIKREERGREELVDELLLLLLFGPLCNFSTVYVERLLSSTEEKALFPPHTGHTSPRL
jgi:hypothetical protein